MRMRNPFRRRAAEAPAPARSAGRSTERRSSAPARIASGAVVALVASGLTYAAVASDGERVHDADLGDGGVWVSWDEDSRFGRMNVPAGQLDAGVAANVPGGGLDVLQDGAAVLAVGRTASSLTPIDVRSARLSESSSIAPTALPTPDGIPVSGTADLRGGTLAMVDPETGAVWADRVDTRTGSVSGLSSSAKPLAEAGGGAALAVDITGAVHVASAESGTVVTIRPEGDGFAEPVTQETGIEAARLDLTAVGSNWVAYDPGHDLVFTAERPEGISAGLAAADAVSPDAPVHATLQMPGPISNAVAVQTSDAVTMVRLDGQAPTGGLVVTERVNRRAVPLLARPAVLAGCVYGAWAEQDRIFYAQNCGRTDAVPAGVIDNVTETPLRSGVAFRTNRGHIVLNDLDTGGVWDLEDRPMKIDNWDSLIPPPLRDDETERKDENLIDDTQVDQPPQAEDDHLKVRAGRTSKLHVLDNDTDASGSVLAINPDDVSDVDLAGVRATVAADGQSIDVVVPALPDRSSFSFTYAVNNGTSAEKSSARVHVEIVPDEVNTGPFLRPGAIDQRLTYPVIEGGRVAVGVAADWRDGESDQVTVLATEEATGIDGQGRLTIDGNTEVGTRVVEYEASDGRGESTTGEVEVEVVAATDDELRLPQTQPDVVRGIVGKPIQVEPLGNDIPGADPGEPSAGLVLAGPVRPVGTLTVDTNEATGVVTITGAEPGTYELAYAARTGGGVSPGRIRVDLAADADPDAPPVANPDSATLRDQEPVMVDVLANDYSPRADVLVTQSVRVRSSSTWIQPTIYQGRWVRLEALEPASLEEGAVRQGTIEYVVSDGAHHTTGEITVSQLPPLDAATPVVEDDVATVRVGDHVTIPVLDNDTMEGGIPLTLDPESVQVIAGGEQTAFASGNTVRFVPWQDPDLMTAEEQVIIEYAAYAGTDLSRRQTGRVTVTVKPLPTQQTPNAVPVARSFSASVVAGERLPITVPTTGVDPDGDSVTITGVTGADGGEVDLSLGRVVTVGPTSIVYEAYPLSAGTEVLHYEVADRFGGTSTGFIRIGVVQPGDPQPPVAVADLAIADPGKRVTVDFTRNDLFDRSDLITLEYEELNDPAVLEQWQVNDEDLTVSTVAPAPDAPVHVFTYGLDNGLFDPSRTSVLVRGVDGFINPPTARDDVARVEDAETVDDGVETILVDALENDDDIDSDPGTLVIDRVLSPLATVEDVPDGSPSGAQQMVRVQVTDSPHTVPYVIQDEDGAEAMALIYVPTGSAGRPFVIDGSLIEMDADSTVTVDLADYVESPRDKPVSITAVDTLSASPTADLSVSAPDNRSLELTSANGYVGPAAVMLEVTDRIDAQDTEFETAYVSIPVQVGPLVPILRCPEFEVILNAGGRDRHIDIPSLCRAWLPLGMSLDDVAWEASWAERPDGVELTAGGVGEREITLHAGPDAPTGSGVLVVSPEGSDQESTISVQVIGQPARTTSVAAQDPDESDEEEAEDPDEPEIVYPPARMRPIQVTGLHEGESQTVNVGPYLDSPLAEPECTVVMAQVVSGEGLEATHSGCEVTLTATTQPSPNALVNIAVTDGPDREAAVGRITVTLLGRPSPPTAVSAMPDRELGGTAIVSWTAPSYDGGSPVTSYVVRWTGGASGSTTCTSSPCTIEGLTNGVDHVLTVAAVNAIGESEPSEPSNAARPDTRPNQVTGVAMTSRGDGTLAVRWQAPANEGSPVQTYRVRFTDTSGATSAIQVETAAPNLTASASGLNNETVYSVAVQALNEAGWGPFGPAVQMQSAGTPPAVGGVSLSPRGPGPSVDSEVLTIRWEPTRPNGPPLTGYTVWRSVGGSGWTQIASTSPGTRQASDTIPYEGRTYSYAVTATNGAGNESSRGSVATYTSVGVPSTPSVSAATPSADRRIRVTVNLGAPRAGSFSSIQWSSSSGASGVYNCAGGCPAGGQAQFTTGELPASGQTITVRTVNSGGSQSQAATSGSVTPYGPTPTPTDGRVTRSGDGRTLNYAWNLPENGRPITAVRVDDRGTITTFGSARTHSVTYPNYATGYSIRVQAQSEAGWSGWLTISGTTGPPPTPTVTLARGEWVYVDPADCPSGQCHKVVVNIRDFPPNTSWTVTCSATNYGPPFTSSARLNVNNTGNGYTWNGHCAYGLNVGTVTATLSNPTHGSYSASIFWS